jgi:hypothetical protein
VTQTALFDWSTPKPGNTFIRRCSKCGCPYEDEEIAEAFTRERLRRTPVYSGVRSRTGALSLRPMCSFCRRYNNRKILPERSGDLPEEQFREKAARCRRSHAERLGYPIAEMEHRFHWITTRMAHDMAHAWRNGCRYCLVPFQLMTNGVRDMTVDIKDRSKEPQWETNVAIVCNDDNRAKYTRTVERWNAYLRAARRWVSWQDGGFMMDWAALTGEQGTLL